MNRSFLALRVLAMGLWLLAPMASAQDTRDGEVAGTDRELNEVYSSIMKSLLPEDQVHLRGAQRAWITMRDADCEWAFTDKRDCLIDRTANRTEELRDTYFWANDGEYRSVADQPAPQSTQGDPVEPRPINAEFANSTLLYEPGVSASVGTVREFIEMVGSIPLRDGSRPAFQGVERVGGVYALDYLVSGAPLRIFVSHSPGNAEGAAPSAIVGATIEGEDLGGTGLAVMVFLYALADQAALHPNKEGPRTAPPPETAPVPERDLLSEYGRALHMAVVSQWKRPTSAPPEGACTVSIVQIPGGEVISVEVRDDCPLDATGRRSIADAVRKASPLPYAGYEAVFNRSVSMNLPLGGS